MLLYWDLQQIFLKVIGTMFQSIQTKGKRNQLGLSFEAAETTQDTVLNYKPAQEP